MHSPKTWLLPLAIVVVACSDDPVTFDTVYEGGQFHLGPVDYAETQFHNACAPSGGYHPQVRAAEGNMLAGLWSGLPDIGSLCDTCIHVKTAKGKEATLRVITYGDTTTNSIDVSQNAFDILDSGEFPREMTWQFVKCDDTGPVIYEFQGAANPDWTSLWVRNARVPLAKVEVKSAKHGSFVELQRAQDGTLTDNQGFGQGQFTIKLTGIDGATYSDTFDWPAGGLGGKLLTGEGNF